VNKGLLDLKEFRVLPAVKEPRELKGLLDPKGPLVHKVQLVCRELPVNKVQQETKELKA